MKNNLWIVLLLVVLIPSNVHGEYMEPVDTYMERAIVLEVEEGEVIEEVEGILTQVQYVKLEIISGKYKGKIFETENHLSDNIAYDIVVKKGDKVVVGIEEYDDDLVEVYVSDYARQNYIFYLLGLFVLLIIVIGREKGIKAVITLAITIFMIMKVLLPLMLKGINPIPISVLVSIGVTIITIFLIGGINSKSISAIVGTSSGVIISGLIAYFVGSQVRLTGLSAEEATMLMYIPQGVDFDFRGLLFSGIILGALGAIMDVGMSIASSIEEIHNANENLTKRELFNSGMNVGKDIMGTMTNTLILAYTGSSIPLLLLFMAYETSMIKIINLDIIATEIVRSLSGSIGLVLTIPLTALISTVLIKRDKVEKMSK
ncbi:YibE/F family protein [[Clostridium] ultunense Esp]|uniref:YibE/F family protein n=1 Tax=[Clostridium] ultunense Esp TaxID=1288971 RepID=M1ZGV5_9FIRM|nr:YibE/F family protein [Schnuerera ultunensis]CCQ97523.1 YibE/F family protein [[Clostridium] ultunense Esp]SHD76129.1 YibE/F family protein [[Clostridium] ultunense Esp]